MATLVVYASAASEAIESFNSSYSYARAGTGTKTLDPGDKLIVGQMFGSPTYYDFESLIWWDTSPLTAAATVLAAVPAFYAYDVGNLQTAFTCNLRLQNFGDTVEATDWVAGASLSALTLLAHLAVTNLTSTSAYTDFIEDALSANVNRTGHTYGLMSSSRHEAGNAPVGMEIIRWNNSTGAGASPEPRLTITYTLPPTTPPLPLGRPGSPGALYGTMTPRRTARQKGW